MWLFVFVKEKSAHCHIYRQFHGGIILGRYLMLVGRLRRWSLPPLNTNTTSRSPHNCFLLNPYFGPAKAQYRCEIDFSPPCDQVQGSSGAVFVRISRIILPYRQFAVLVWISGGELVEVVEVIEVCMGEV